MTTPIGPTGAPTPVGSKPTTPTKTSFFDKTKHGGKAAFDKGWAIFEKLGVPVNKLTNKIGSEAFWPTTLDHESDKSARILKSFCKDGFYKEQVLREGAQPGPKGKPKVLVKIPQKVIQNCVGLAIFSVMRTGLWVSGAGGSGVLIAKKADGTWSEPSGLLIHTLGVGFMMGIDIYDCVLVINSQKALDAFSKLRVSLGGEISVVAGPLGVGGNLESELLKDRKPIFSYMKSRGLYGGIQLDGTIIVERNDENARFYGERLGVRDILAGKVKHAPVQTKMLMEVLKDAEGRKDVDHAVLDIVNAQPAPGDLDIDHHGSGKPTAAQQAAYAPPHGFYAPTEGYPADVKIDHAAAQGQHPTHPGFDTHEGHSGTYYPPPPPPNYSSTAPTSQAPAYGAPHEGHSGTYYPPPPPNNPSTAPTGQAPAHGPQREDHSGNYYSPPQNYPSTASANQVPDHGAPSPMAYLQGQNMAHQGAPSYQAPQTTQTPYFPPPPPSANPPSQAAQDITQNVQDHGNAQNTYYRGVPADEKSSHQ